MATALLCNTDDVSQKALCGIFNSYTAQRYNSMEFKVGLSRNIWTPEMYRPPPWSKYFEIFGPPLKYLDRVRSACCLHV